VWYCPSCSLRRQSLADDPDGCAKWPENGPGSGRARGGCSSSGSLRAAAAAAGRHILGPRVYPDTAPESVSCNVGYVRYIYKYGRAGVCSAALPLAAVSRHEYGVRARVCIWFGHSKSSYSHQAAHELTAKHHAHSLSTFHTHTHTLAHTTRSHTHATPVRTHTRNAT
jgi:hypothetical protein